MLRNNYTDNYTPSHIANYILFKAWKENNQYSDITVMKLIKLVYIAYGWNLAIYNKPLFKEKILAWKYGPVIPSIYHEFKKFSHLPITRNEYSSVFDLNSGELCDVPIVEYSNRDVIKILNAVWENYKDKSAYELSKITHENDSPWSKAWNKGLGENTPLKDDDIKKRSLEAINKFIATEKSKSKIKKLSLTQ